jgi:two-component system response regulator YesN
LLVEDDDKARNALAAVISTEHEVIMAATGAHALEACTVHAIDVICTSLEMRGMSGLELLGKIDDRGLRVGAVLVTGNVEMFRAAARRDFKNLFFSVLFKPFDQQRLLSVIRRAGMFTAMNRSVRAAHRATERLRTGEFDVRDLDTSTDESGGDS